MRSLYLLLFMLLGITAFTQASLEREVMKHLANDEYQLAVERCEEAIRTEQYRGTGYFLLAEVYTRSLGFCQASEIQSYYIAMLAFQTYTTAYRKYGKHDLQVLNNICRLLPSKETLEKHNIRMETQVSVACFGKATNVYSKYNCRGFQPSGGQPEGESIEQE